MPEIYTQSPIQNRVDQARSTFGNDPSAVARGVAGNMTQSSTFQEPIQGQIGAVDAMQQIKDYDTKLASQVTQGNQQQMNQTQQGNAVLSAFGSLGSTPQQTIAKAQAPLPTTTVQPPVQGFLSPFVAEGLASGQQRSAGDVFSLAGQTRSSLEKVVGSEAEAYGNAVANQLALEQAKEEKLQQDFENALALAKLTGASSITDPRTGEVIPINSQANLSVGEKEQFRLKDQALNDIKGSMTPADLFAKYRGVVDFNDLLTMYNQNSPFGPAKENVTQLRSLYEGEKTGPDLSVSDKNFYRSQAMAKESVVEFVENLEELQELTAEIGVLGAFAPNSPQVQRFNSKKDLLGRQLARLVEVGVISNQDAEFYGNKLPTSVIGPQGIKDEKINSAIDFAISAAATKYGTSPQEIRQATEVRKQLFENPDQIQAFRSELQTGEQLYFDMNTGEYVALGIEDVPTPGMIRI